LTTMNVAGLQVTPRTIGFASIAPPLSAVNVEYAS
jgi:hypothetical protein